MVFTMQYEIKYRVTAAVHRAPSCGASSMFPVLDVRYRKRGKGSGWVPIGSAEIDLFAYIRFRNTYYKELIVKSTPLDAIKSMSDYERLSLFIQIINHEFNGSIDEFVTSLVKEEIAMRNAETEEVCEINLITSTILTRKWKCANINI